MIKVYHNPRCSKSRCALDYLNEKGIQFDVIEYLNAPFTKDELRDVLNKLGISAEELLRKNETEFKENFKGKTLSNEEWIDAMIKFPKLIERPIVVNQDKAVVARPTEKIDEIL
ncbi:MAG: arsenate reductase (glutaredoxin) [Bacteroidetes bacterium]|nr:MAG: arsenate reductase (glutaredoxin) [Bacteroidota bacterium]